MPQSFFGALMVPELSIADLNWDQLEQAAHLTFTESQRSQLLKTLNNYLVERTRAIHAPTAPAVRRRLLDIAKYANTLVLWLNDGSEAGQTAMALGFPFHQIDPTTLAQLLRSLALTTRAAQQDLTAQAGRPDNNTALVSLIQEWHVLYCQAGGPKKGCYKDRYSGQFRGRFLDLLDAALQQAAMIVTRKDPREPQSRVPQREQEWARQKLMKIIHIPRVTLAKRIMDTLKTHT